MKKFFLPYCDRLMRGKITGGKNWKFWKKWGKWAKLEKMGKMGENCDFDKIGVLSIDLLVIY
ncbi:hypothetical protein HYW31_00880 [Candidatus Berkelbacteria bacterium]|nr:hypothetical protein [Candidatus Berkelbacteria bacterium]